MDKGSDILFRSTGEVVAPPALASSALDHVDWFAAIGIVSAIAVAVIVLSTRWSIRSMVAAAKAAIDQVGEASPSAAVDGFRTVGIGRAEASGASKLAVFRGRSGERRDEFISTVARLADVMAVATHGDGASVEVVAGDGEMARVRQEALAHGFVAAAPADPLSLRDAETLAERDAMDDAVRGLRAIATATGTTVDPKTARIRRMSVETLQLPVRGSAGQVVKRIEVTWDLGEAMRPL